MNLDTYYTLHSDFFETRAIKKLRKMAGGDTYTVIYLKMLVLASMNDGRILSEGIGSPLGDELGIALNERTENVNAALFFLKDCGLIEIISDKEIVFRYFKGNPAYTPKSEGIEGT